MRNHGRTTGTNADSFRRFEVITGVGGRRWSLEKKAQIVAKSLVTEQSRTDQIAQRPFEKLALPRQAMERNGPGGG